MGEREGERDGLPAGWTWAFSSLSQESLVPDGAREDGDEEVAFAGRDGLWTTYERGRGGGRIDPLQMATPRPGESLLAAAQREAEAALWRCDGFGVGEVRGVVLPASHREASVGGGGNPIELPGLPGLWTATDAFYVGGALTVNARRVDARPAGNEVPPVVPMRCQGCGDDIAEGSPFFERVDDGCPFCRGCAAENAAGDDPDEMRAAEMQDEPIANPESDATAPPPEYRLCSAHTEPVVGCRACDLGPARTPPDALDGTGVRLCREDAVGLVREPFAPSAKAAAETVAEMRRVTWSPEDAGDLFLAASGETAQSMADKPSATWEQIPDDKAITVRVDDGPDADRETRTAGEWAREIGRGLAWSENV